MTVQRKDFVRSRVSKIEKFTDENGYGRFEATPTRVGVLEYKCDDGTIIRELRHPDDVFSPESMETLSLVPVTLEHRGGFVKPETSSEQTKGTTGENITIEGDHLKCTIAVYDREALDSIAEDDMFELSAGYRCETVPEKGVYGGKPYDFRQINIRYNHVTATKEGRAGNSCRLRLDSKGAAYVDRNDNNENKNGANKMKVKYDGYSMDGLNLDAFEYEENEDTKMFKKALDTCTSEMKKMKEDMMKMKEKKSDSVGSDEAKLDSLQIKVESFEKQIQEQEKKIKNSVPKEKMDSLIFERGQILEVCKTLDYKIPTEGTFEEINEQAKFDILVKAGYEKEKFDSIQGYKAVAWDTYYKDHEKINRDVNSLENLSRFKENRLDSEEDFSTKPL
jgi:hypothetical protein